jgi:hypothetical protein
MSVRQHNSKQAKKMGVRTFDGTFVVITILFLLVISIFLCFPYWFTQFKIFEWGFSDKPGEIGDAIGGTLGPFVAIAAAILTFLAFWVQFKANEQQRRDLQIERFENKFYELLRLHRANVDELNIADRVTGRKCFVQLFNELKYAYLIVKDQFNVQTEEEKELYSKHKIDLLKFSYTIFFYGVGVNSEKELLPSFNEAENKLYWNCKTVFTDYQTKYIESKKEHPNIRYFTFDLPLNGIPDERTKVFYYLPFNGHTARLGHFYRHLFQTVKYIVEQDTNLFDFKEKYSYVKMLRAQLSNHEQLLLYYNSVAWFPNKWKLYFTDYRLIKNIPLKLADFGISPEEKYKDDIARLAARNITMFEGHE